MLKQRRCGKCFKPFLNGTDGETCDLSEFAFDHWDPDGLLDSLNEKGNVEPAHNISNFRATSDMHATTLKHRDAACHQRGRRNFAKGRN